MRHLKLALLNIWVWSLFVSFTGIVAPLLSIVVVALVPFLPKSRIMKIFRGFIRFYGQVVIRLPYPFIRVNFTDKAGLKMVAPYIFICNHRSTIDAFLMAVFPIAQGVQVANRWPFSIPVLGFYAKKADYIDITAYSTEELMSVCRKFLDAQVPVIFFPEGTRAKTREMGIFRGAAFELFRRAGVPIVPVCISGSEIVMPKGSLVLHPGIVEITALPEVHLDSFAGLNNYVIKNRVRKLIESELVGMDAR